jgi:hypothetical protein
VIRILAEAAIDSVSAAADITLGARLDVPADSIAKLDVADSSQNQLSGWIPTFTPVAPNLSGEIDVHGHIGPRVNLELGILFLQTGVATGLSLGAPQLTLDLVAAANSAGGICNDASVDAGVSVEVGLGAELDAFGGFGKPQDVPNKLALFSTSTPLFSTCFPIGDATPTATAAPGPTGTSTTFLNDNCDPAQSGSNQLTEGACVAAGLVGNDFQSGSVTFELLDQGAGCILQYYSDSGCANAVGPVCNPTSPNNRFTQG